jgi:hypothetical protein
VEQLGKNEYNCQQSTEKHKIRRNSLLRRHAVVYDWRIEFIWLILSSEKLHHRDFDWIFSWETTNEVGFRSTNRVIFYVKILRVVPGSCEEALAGVPERPVDFYRIFVPKIRVSDCPLWKRPKLPLHSMHGIEEESQFPGEIVPRMGYCSLVSYYI